MDTFYVRFDSSIYIYIYKFFPLFANSPTLKTYILQTQLVKSRHQGAKPSCQSEKLYKF